MTVLNADPLATGNITWNLADLFKSLNDPAIENEVAHCRLEASDLKKEYDGRIKDLSAEELLSLLSRMETLEATQGKLATYAFLNFATRTREAEAGGFLQRIKEILSEIGRETVFFELEWNRVSEETAQRLLTSTALAPYRHYLEALRRLAPHQLSRAEETLLIEKSPVGRSSWNTLFDKVMGHLEFGERKRSEEEVLTDLYSPDRPVRHTAAQELTNGLRSQLHILTHIFNTILADKMIDDRLRSFGSWISSMNLHNELDHKTVTILIDAVTSRYDLVARYYHLKKELLGVGELMDYDRYAPLPNLPKQNIPWPECRDMVLTAFAEFSPEMAQIAGYFFDQSWIHAPLQEGKRGGAFAHPCVPEVHPYVMVNYAGTARDVSTVAHELGHGVHQYLAARQGYYNSGTPLVLAETASVFAELLLFKNQLAGMADREQRKAFTCQKLESIFATVFRQVAMNRFEDRMHCARRDQGELTPDDLSRHWLETQRAMFGNSVTLSEEYGIWWSYIPHFLNSPGYVYSYAFGELLVLALYNLYLKDPEGFVPLYLALLESGGKDTPYHLLKPFGIDLNDPAFWQGGLEIIDTMLREIE
ncbi:MAG: M3 family oligoendopeptidase [Proteobacteria bacterium]|nr:M3 family oligoendopeptidase [Pseudomonadota bacterium]MBU1688044.1 M3 family oligoendopeptidase [Pseudomonadota bacterium]